MFLPGKSQGVVCLDGIRGRAYGLRHHKHNNPGAHMAERLLTLPEIAEMTRLPVSTLRYYRHRGRGPETFKLGRRVVAWEGAVRTWMEARRVSDQ